jgi:hypothetical protein
MTNVGASSSTGKGKKRATLAGQQDTGAARHDAVAPPPLQEAAAPVAFPITGVSGAVAQWSTAAALAGAASRAAALPQPPSSPPLVFADAGGHLVPVPLRFFGYAPMPGTTTAPPLAAVLDRFHSTTLSRMISMLMAVCKPPLRQHESRSGPPPRWWPTASEEWWAAEVEAHLPHVPMPVPFVCCKILKKVHRVAVLVAIVKHLSPDFGRLDRAMRQCRLSPSETALWDSALGNEQARCQRPVYIAEMQQQHGHGLLSPSHAGGVIPPSDDDGGQVVAELVEQPQEQQVAAGDGGTDLGDEAGVQVAAAVAELEKPLQPEQAAGDVGAANVFSPSGFLEDMMLPFPEGQAHDIHYPADHSGMDELSVGAAAAEVQEEPAEERASSWYDNQELRRLFTDMPIRSPQSFDNDWFKFD